MCYKPSINVDTIHMDVSVLKIRWLKQLVVVNLRECLGAELMIGGDIFERIKLARSSNANVVNAPLNCSAQSSSSCSLAM